MASSGVTLDKAKIRKLALKISKAGMTEAAEYAVGEVKEMLDKPGSGRIYASRRTKGGHIMHQASAPGEPPAPDTGALRKSITRRIKTKGGNVYGYVGTKLGYAKPLEYGTRKMAARPYLRPVIKGKKRQIRDAFRRGAKRAQGGLG